MTRHTFPESDVATHDGNPRCRTSYPAFSIDGEVHVAVLHHVRGDLELLHSLLAGQVVHQVEHQLFQNHAQAARAHLAVHRFARDAAQRVIGEAQLHVLKLEQPLILLDDRILRLGQDLDQRVFVQIVQHANHGQAADELGNQAELDQVLRLDLRQQLGVALVAPR